MSLLSSTERERALGMLQAGYSSRRVARVFNCLRTAIDNLRDRYHTTDFTADRPRPGLPRVTNAQR